MNITKEMLEETDERVEYYGGLMECFNGDDLSPKMLIQDNYDAWTKLKAVYSAIQTLKLEIEILTEAIENPL